MRRDRQTDVLGAPLGSKRA